MEDDYVLLWVCPCGDICGDTKDDVVVVSRSSETTSTVRALQGSNGDEIWSRSFEDTIIHVGPCEAPTGASSGARAVQEIVKVEIVHISGLTHTVISTAMARMR